MSRTSTPRLVFKNDAARLDAYEKIAREFPYKSVHEIAKEMGIEGKQVMGVVTSLRKMGINIPRKAGGSVFKKTVQEYFQRRMPELMSK